MTEPVSTLDPGLPSAGAQRLEVLLEERRLNLRGGALLQETIDRERIVGEEVSESFEHDEVECKKQSKERGSKILEVTRA